MITYRSITISMDNGESFAVTESTDPDYPDYVASVAQQLRNQNARWIRLIEYHNGNAVVTLLNRERIGYIAYDIGESYEHGTGTVQYTCEPFVDPNCPACP